MMIGWLVTMPEPIKMISNTLAIDRLKIVRARQIPGPITVVKNSVMLTPLNKTKNIMSVR